MGNCCSLWSDWVESKEGVRSQQIDAELKHAKQSSKNTVRTLLLGTGETGKSTFIKQLKIILHPDYGTTSYESGYTPEERKHYVEIIDENIGNCLAVLKEAMEKLQVDYDPGSSNKKNIERLTADDIGSGRITEEQAYKIRSIWKDKGIQKVFGNAEEDIVNKRHSMNIKLPDYCQHFMERIIKIGSPDYIPNNDDIVNSRLQTTGLVEHRFNVRGTEFVFIDVGGQKGERRKWLPCFDEVTSVIFMTSLNDYDLKLTEVGSTDKRNEKNNRMIDSVDLWGKIVNHEALKNALMIVFLNKLDLFKEKLKAVPFGSHIDDYEEPKRESFMDDGEYYELRVENCLEHIKQMYASKVDDKDRNESAEGRKITYIHTTATDTDGIHKVFNAIQNKLIEYALRKAGML